MKRSTSTALARSVAAVRRWLRPTWISRVCMADWWRGIWGTGDSAALTPGASLKLTGPERSLLARLFAPLGRGRPLLCVPRPRRGCFRPGLELLEARVVPSSFTAGDLVLARVGNGGSLTSAAAPVFLDEYTPSGTFVETVSLPTTSFGSNQALTLSGNGISEGGLELSEDGAYLTLAGYDASVGTSSVASTTSSSTNRIVASVEYDSSSPNTATRISTGFSGGSVDDAESLDGNGFWVTGSGSSSSGGIRYVSSGSSGSSTQLSSSPTSDINVSIVADQLYVTSAASGYNGVDTVGTYVTETSGQTTTLLSGLSGTGVPMSFVLLARSGSTPDTLYVADQSNGLLKFSYTGSTWVSEGSESGSFTGLTGYVSGSDAVLYATEGTAAGNSLVSFTDTAASNASISGSFTTLATAGSGEVFRGLAFAPHGLLYSQSPWSGSEGSTISIAAGGDSSGTDGLTYSASGLPSGVSINASTGLIAGIVGYANAASGSSASLNTTIQLSDAQGLLNSTMLTWSIADLNRLPNVTVEAGTVGQSVSIPFSGTDNTGTNTLTYSMSGAPGGVSINGSSGLISGTLASSDAPVGGVSAYYPTVTLTDNNGGTDSRSFAWLIGNPSPSITNPGTQSSTEGASVALTISASDSTSGATLTFGATGLPAGLAINPSTGIVSGTLAVGAANNGPYTTTITASDGTDTGSQAFTWNVSAPVSLTNPGPQTSVEGTSLTLTLSATDTVGGSTLTYSGSGLPPGLAVAPNTGVISGTVALGAAAGGPYDVTLQAGDGTYSASDTLTWSITSPISQTSIPAQVYTEGNSVSLSVSASDSIGGSTLAYTATDLPPGLVIGKSSGIITGTIAAGSAPLGPFNVVVTAADGTYSSKQTIALTVNSPIVLTTPADQTNNEGDSVSLSVSASDSASGTTLTYGAVGLPSGLSISSSTGTITGTVATGDATNGPYSVTLFAEDGTYSASTNFSWTVNGAVTLTAPAGQSNNTGDSISLQVAASDGTHTLTFSASGLPGGASINASTGLITGTLTAGGNFEPTVTAAYGTLSASAGFSWAASGPITITDDGPQTFNAGDAVSVPISASDTASGTLTFSASALPAGTTIDSGTGLISGTLASTLAAGNYESTITASDGTNSAVDVFDWTITGPGDVTISNPGTQTSTEGGTVSLTLSTSYTGSGTLSYSAIGLPPGLTLNPSTGVISGTVSGGDAVAGPYSVTVSATDGTDSDSQTFSWNVNSVIGLTQPADQSSVEGASVSLALSVTYSGGGTLSYSALGLPPGLKISSTTGTITGTIAVGDGAGGPYAVTVQAAVNADVVQQTFNWTVTAPVTLTLPADQTNNEGDSVSLSLSASDSIGGTTLSYSALGLPPGLKINPSTGIISGTIALGDAADGPYSVTVVAQDGTYSATQTFNWNVNSPVTIVPPGDQTNNEGDSISLAISASDTMGGSTLKYVAEGLPPGLVINTSTGTISGTIPVGAAANGPYSATVIVGDGTYSAQQTFTWDINAPIAITDQGDQSNSAGDSVSVSLSATDSASGTVTFSASGLPSGTSINAATGLISGTLTAGGTWSPIITATDGTYSSTDTFFWSVSSPIFILDQGDPTNAIGDSVSVALSATDSAGGTLTFSASNLPPGTSINASTGLISGTVSSSASTTTPYAPTITVTDGTNTAVDFFSWSISPAGMVVLTSPGNQSNTAGDMVALAVQATDSDSEALAFSATNLPAGLYLNPVTGLIFGTISSGAVSSSPYAVTVYATDLTYSASTTFDWTIGAAGTVTLSNPGDQTNNEGDSVSLTLTAADTSSGTLSFQAFGLPPGLKINTSTGTITGTVALGDAASGPFAVIVVADDGTSSATQNFNWNLNCPITLTAPADQTNNEGDSVSLAISASDTVSGSTLSYSALGLPPGLTISPSTGTITGTLAAGDAATGAFSATIVVGDGTYSASQSFNWNVNSPITIAVPADQTNNEGDSVSVSLSASDSISGTTLTFSVQGLPPGLTFNSSTGAITGTIAVGDSGIGAFSPTIVVSDGTYSASASFNWYVNSLISITDPGDQENTVGDTVSLPIPVNYTGSGTLSYAATGLPTGLSINTSTGAITGTISSGATAIGSFTTTITVTDGTTSASDTFGWTINAAGSITLSTPSAQSSAEGASVSLALSASGGGTKHYFAEDLPPGLVINPGTGAITGTVAVNDGAFGPFEVTVFATDGSNFAQETFPWATDNPITLTALADQTNNEGDSVSLSLSASDSVSGSTLTFGAVGLPAGLKINPSTGAITGTVAPGDAANGPYTVTITTGDGTHSAALTLTWSITSPIALTLPSDQSVEEGDSVSLTLSASDSIGGSTLTFSAVGLPAGLAISPTTGTITGTVAAGAAANSPYSVTVSASDGTYSSSQVLTFAVTSPISIAPISEEDFAVGQTINLNVAATGSGTLSYIATGLPAGLIIARATGVISGTISNSAAAVGVFTVQVEVTNGTFSAVQSFVIDAIAAGLGLGTMPVQAQLLPPVAQLLPPVPAANLPAMLSQILLKSPSNSITLSFVNSLVDNREVEGRLAAAAAVLKADILENPGKPGTGGLFLDLFVANVKTWDPLNMSLAAANIRAFSQGLANGNAKAVQLNNLYLAAINRIDSYSANQLFKMPPAPTQLWETVQQGAVGDCAFVATAIGFAKTKGLPGLQARIEQVPGAGGVPTYRVTMPDGDVLLGTQTRTVTRPTDGQLALYGGTTNGALWLSVWEAAYVQAWGERQLSQSTYVSSAALYDVALNGERAVVAVRRVARKATWHTILHFAISDVQLRDWLKASASRIVVVGTRQYMRTNIFLQPPSQHAFAVVGFNGGMVTLRNPWNNGDPWGRTKTISLSYFRDYFNVIAIED